MTGVTVMTLMVTMTTTLVIAGVLVGEMTRKIPVVIIKVRMVAAMMVTIKVVRTETIKAISL
jgi:hypothetical protein